MGVERLCEGANFQIPFNADEINLIYQFGEQGKAVMRKPDTLVADFPDTYSLMEQDEVSKTYSFPKSYVSYRKPREVSAEQRERARQMMITKNKTKKV